MHAPMPGPALQAVADFTRPSAFNPTRPRAMPAGHERGWPCSDVDGAIADYSEALRLAPGNARIYTARGHAHFVKGDTNGGHRRFHGSAPPQSQSAPARSTAAASPIAGQAISSAPSRTTRAALALNPDLRARLQQPRLCREARAEERRDRGFPGGAAARSLADRRRDGLEAARRSPSAWLTETRAAGGGGQGSWSRRIAAACHAVGAKGASPNKKAPEFRDAARASSRVSRLREPLSRGIAAPHDEMPKFALSGPEIDAIVAYINSLSCGLDDDGEADRRGGNAEAIADGEDLAMPARGSPTRARNVRDLPQRSEERMASRPTGRRPPFKRIAEHARHVGHGADRVVAHDAIRRCPISSSSPTTWTTSSPTS